MQLRQEGRREGRQEGWQQGHKDGETAAARRLLSRLLRLRFGPLPPWAEQQLEQAELAQLENWSDAVLTAESLTEILQSTDPT
jgi:predicted transposase YdaD